jgi:excisionase family DNA binding protein
MKNLTIAEACRRSGFSRYAITQACRAGDLTHYRIGQKGYRIPQMCLEAWMRSLKRGHHVGV